MDGQANSGVDAETDRGGAGYALYWERMSGAVLPQCLMDEMGLRWRRIPVDMAAEAHKADAYRAVCPTMRVPALVTPEGETIGETGAIAVLLGERHPEAGLVPRPGEPDRAAFLFWLFYMASVGYPTFSRAWHPEQFAVDAAAHGPIRAVAADDLDRLFGVLDAAIAGRPFFLARGFTALDVYLAMLTRWDPDRDALFARRRRIAALCAAVEARPRSGAAMREHFGA